MPRISATSRCEYHSNAISVSRSISLLGREIIFQYNSSFSISSTHAKRWSLWKEYLSHTESALENFFNRADIDSPCSIPLSQELSERGCVHWNSVLFFLNTFRSWIYNKKVDKYDKIEDRKRRNKKCLQKIRNTPRNISKQ